MQEKPIKTAVKSNLTQHVRNLLRTRRRGLTLETLADKCDCSVQWLSNFLNDNQDKRDPGVKKICQLYEELTGSPLLFDPIDN